MIEITRNSISGRILFVLLAFALTIPASAESADPLPPAAKDLASYDWTTHAKRNLADHPPPDDVVSQFLNSMVSEPGIPMALCSFRFADLKHNGVLSLVLGADVSGRGLCRQFYVVDKGPHGFQTFGLDGEWGQGSDVANEIEDAGNDGHLELLYQDQLSSRVTGCVPSWTVLYGWTGRGYTDVSARYKNFYRKRLIEIQIKLAAKPQEGTDEAQEQNCLIVEAARIRQFLGIYSNAGVDKLARLSRSGDPADRESAAYQLAAIATPEARELLKTLSNDPDAAVAYMGKHYLAQVKAGPYQPPGAIPQAGDP